ncbi:limonene-1,2-epoxide hydrolase [Williamsia sterculiae]|uniref:Limonene-1,2-epoxide hydrolase n=1 Tax=Williamsia sterculiae TaxID=1344003 RepID=A0A1N7F6C8_9NOCA|nr:limonene-1,2-epoxide hydrolase [Williamsia sterculiae]
MSPAEHGYDISRDVVSSFLRSLTHGDIEAALALVGDDIVYTNVSLATLRGKQRTAAALRLLNNRWAGMKVQVDNIAANGTIVLTERIDEIRVGPLFIHSWVCGRFEVRGGQIVVWRDYFDFFATAKACARGLAAIVFPRLRIRLTRGRDSHHSYLCR